MGETKYFANMQIHITCHRKNQNKSSLTRTSAVSGLLWVVRWSGCAALSHLLTVLSCCLQAYPLRHFYANGHFKTLDFRTVVVSKYLVILFKHIV